MRQRFTMLHSYNSAYGFERGFLTKGLFLVAWFFNLFRLNFSTPYQRRESKFKLLTLGILFVVALVVTGIPYLWLSDPGVDAIRLQINSAKDLSLEAPVMMKGLEVGRVESIELDDGAAVAMLEIDGEHFDEIPAGSEFIIGSLNTLLPGNVGVIVVPPKESADFEISMVDGVRSEVASDHILPRQIPFGLYLAIGAGVLVSAVALGVALNIAKSTIVIKLFISSVLAFLTFLVVQGVIPIPSLEEQLERLPPLPEIVAPEQSQ